RTEQGNDVYDLAPPDGGGSRQGTHRTGSGGPARAGDDPGGRGRGTGACAGEGCPGRRGIQGHRGLQRERGFGRGNVNNKSYFKPFLSSFIFNFSPSVPKERGASSVYCRYSSGPAACSPSPSSPSREREILLFPLSTECTC